MNGEITTYRINSPMTWQEFKAMPDDLKRLYINWLREKFNAPDSEIADMLGVHRTSLSKLLHTSGLQNSKRRGSRVAWDSEGFTAWRNGVASGAAERVEETTTQEKETVCLDPLEAVEPMEPAETAAETTPARTEPLLPVSGCMQFDGPADQALQVIGNALRGAHVRLYVSWAPIPTEDNASPGTAKG